MPTFPLDPSDPEAAIAAAAKRCSNWGRWGTDDVHGTLNHLTDAKRRQGAALVRRGESFSLAQSFDMNGPQKGWRRRTNPVHTMLDTGVDAERGNQGFPHGHRRRRRRDLHAAAGLHPVGRARPHLRPRQRLERPPRRRCRHQRGRPGHRYPDRDRPDQRPRRPAGRRPGRSGRTVNCRTVSPSPPSTWKRPSNRQGAEFGGRRRRPGAGAHRPAGPGPPRWLG